jgi:hypothetical protein
VDHLPHAGRAARGHVPPRRAEPDLRTLVRALEARVAELAPDAWPKVAIAACRLAVNSSEVEDGSALAALRQVELEHVDDAAAASIRELSESLDEAAWDAQEAGDEARYDSLFRQSRPCQRSPLPCRAKPDEAIYEAAYAVGTPEDLLRGLTS